MLPGLEYFLRNSAIPMGFIVSMSRRSEKSVVAKLPAFSTLIKKETFFSVNCRQTGAGTSTELSNPVAAGLPGMQRRFAGRGHLAVFWTI